MISHAKDQYVWDADGNQYLDFFGGIVTVSVGHCNEEVNRKVHAQMDTLQHVSTVFATEPQAALAKKIASITPNGKLTKSFFTNSGTEANETAILAARCYTGSSEIVALRYSYHGRSALAMALSAQAPWRLGRRHAPGHRPRGECLLLPLPAGPDVSELQRALRARRGGGDSHHHLGPHRRIHRRADSGRRRIRHAAQGVLPHRRRHRARNTAAFSSATKCRRPGAAPAASGSASSSGAWSRTSSPARRVWATDRPSA